MISNQMRIGGLASGMDIDSIVGDLMKAERMPLDKLMQKKQTLEWQRDDYREMNKLLNDLDTLIFDGINRQRTFLQKTVTSSDESAVSARAVNVSGNFSANINVTQLASAATWVSASDDLDEKIGADFKASENNELKFRVTTPDGKEKDVTISIAEGDSLTEIVRKLNHSDLGVNVFLDDNDENDVKIVMSMNETGAGAEIKLADDDQGKTIEFMETLGFQVNNGVLTKQSEGQNAIFEINGYKTERTSNIFAINGMEYTLKNITDRPVTISTSTDTDAILDSIVKFVDEYNKAIETINGKLTEERFRDYKPLTEVQKEEMTEKQIELWEEKAKSGMLRSDSILSSGLAGMRMDLYSPVTLGDGTTLHLSDIGITTSTNYRDNGKLIIDENKLRAAISEDPNKVYELFNAGSRDAAFENQGIAARLRNSIDRVTTAIEEKAGNALRTNQQFSLGRNLIDVDEQIARMEARLLQVENRYWRQFTAMEQAIQRANQQSMFLMEQFGGY